HGKAHHTSAVRRRAPALLPLPATPRPTRPRTRRRRDPHRRRLPHHHPRRPTRRGPPHQRPAPQEPTAGRLTHHAVSGPGATHAEITMRIWSERDGLGVFS